ncbi:MAG: hypothetical protein ABIL58_21555 [Pseudomonadota bacterium]
MMEKDKLRRADVFSGTVCFLFGLWVISQAVKMPMKGSWGGVQNVWFVSPALFPLLVGAMIAFLGALLVRIALKTTGSEAIAGFFRWLSSPDLLRYLSSPPTIRFYAIVVLFTSYVYLSIPRIDFFLCSVLFLSVFITMFYLEDDRLLEKLFLFYLAETVLLFVYVSTKLPAVLGKMLPYPGDWLCLAFIFAYCAYAWRLSRGTSTLRKKYRTSIILSIVAPVTIGAAFKYLLLVPMPNEGLIVAIMDAIRYWDF